MNNEKGVTLITLVVTIIILMILTVTISVNVEDYKIRKMTNEFETDLLILNEEINQYYSREKELPIINKYDNKVIEEIEKNSNDNENYYVIDISKLGVDLNYGKGYKEVEKKPLTEVISIIKDVYIINEQSHTIYYPKGIDYGNQINYSITNKYTQIQDVSLIKVLRDNGVYLKENKTIEDENGNKVIIPEGFKIAEDSGLTVDEGIIIEDDDITVDGNGNQRGNQYVWIPVGRGIKKYDGTTVDITLGRYRFADGTNDRSENGATVLPKGTPILVQDIANYANQTENVKINTYFYEDITKRYGIASSGTDGLNATALSIEKFKMSVQKNGGYYIARYEASYGIDGKVNSKISTGIQETSSSTRIEGMLWNYITQLDAVVACRGLYGNKVTTDLINSYAWDTAIVYIQEFSGDSDYSYQTSKNIGSDASDTGKNNDEVCKISDMASNTKEWTTEYCDYKDSSIANPCTARGGYFGNSSNYTSSRDCYNAPSSYSGRTFRGILYM